MFDRSLQLVHVDQTGQGRVQGLHLGGSADMQVSGVFVVARVKHGDILVVRGTILAILLNMYIHVLRY